MPASAKQAPAPTEQPAWDRALERLVCVHCGSELGPAWRSAEGPFCCRGCATVYNLIQRSGLQRYYDLRQGRQPPPAVLRPDSFAWLDRLLAKETLTAGQSSARIVHLSLDIQGVHCAACVWLLEELFRRAPGGLDMRINPTLGQVDLTWDQDRGELKAYLAEVESFGYRFGPARKEIPARSRDLLLRMAICIAIALNVMMFSISFYLGLTPRDGALYPFFGRLSLFLASIAVVVGGQVFLRGAVAGLRHRMAHLDLPISLGIILAYLGSLYGYVTSGPDAAYFDSLTTFIALMLAGRWAQEHILERNRHALLTGAGADNLTAKRQRDGRLDAITAAEIRRGDELWITPGDLVPVAGILLRRSASVSLDWITGESDISGHEPGDTIPAGSFNAGRSGFAISACEDFADSRLHELLRSGPGSAGSRAAPRTRWGNRLGGIYVLVVLLLATGGFLIWANRDAAKALEVTVAILVVTCPCALGLAVPLARELVHFALRRRGIFLRTASFLDKALEVRKILLDKTGTVTLGRLVPTPASHQALRSLAPDDRSRLCNMAARSNHPVSRALAEAVARVAGVTEPAPVAAFSATLEDLTEEPGQGLTWRQGGGVYRLGRGEFALTGDDRSAIPGEAAAGGSRPATYFSVDGRMLAAFRFNEEFRQDAAREIARLQEAGYDVYLLSGDDPAKVATAAETLGIPASHAEGGLTPEAKAARVIDLDRADTLMVGDGLNDSPSFSAAHCSATPAVDRPVLPGKADFYFLGDGLAALRRALAAASHLRRVVRDNLALAIVYNLAAVGLCLAGRVSPVVAAILMPLSSVAVVSLTAYRLSGRRLKWMS